MPPSEYFANVLSREALQEIKDISQQIQLSLDDLDDLKTRAICKNNIAILQVVEESKTAKLVGLFAEQMRSKLENSAKQIILNLGSLDDANTRRICKNSIKILKIIESMEGSKAGVALAKSMNKVDDIAKEIILNLGDLEDTKKRVICKHTIDILRLIDENTTLAPGTYAQKQTLPKLEHSANQILLNLDDLDDPKTRMICKQTIYILKAINESKIPTLDNSTHERAGPKRSRAVHVGLASPSVEDTKLPTTVALDQPKEIIISMSEATSDNSFQSPKPIAAEKPVNDSQAIEQATVIEQNARKRAALPLQNPSNSKRPRTDNLANNVGELKSGLKGVWTNVYSDADKKFHHNWLPKSIKVLIHREDFQGHYFKEHRDINVNVNTPKLKQCWLSMYDTRRGEAWENVSMVPADTGPCGMCRKRMEGGERDVVCFYFKSRTILSAFKVSS